MAPESRAAPLRIVLIGMPGSGKSAVARAVAEELGWRHVDCDDLIVAQEARSIPEIFSKDGEARFREIERAIVARVAQMESVAVSTGGGAILTPENREQLWRGGFVVGLQARPQTLLERVGATTAGAGSRPLLSGADPYERLQALATERAPLYQLADWTIPTDGLSSSEVAAEVVRSYRAFGDRLSNRADRMRPHQSEAALKRDGDDVAATVRTPTGDYEIVVGWDTLQSLGRRLRSLGVAGRVRIITDEHVAAVHAEAVLSSLSAADYETSMYALRPGEDNKTLSAAKPVFDWLVSERAERGEAIVAAGGGVVTDLAGFVAATFLRGVPLVHVPTSLLGAVDAAIGGKVAVDHRLGKNLIGAFYQPRLVLIDAALLRTLPPRELTSGWAEVIKHGLISDRNLIDYLEKYAGAVCSLQPAELLPVLRRSVEIKAAVVSADERETGLRSTLNYGHTIGHALEAALAYTGPLHGEAVAVGMAGAGEIGRRLGLLTRAEKQRQNDLIAAYGLPLDWKGAVLEDVLSAMTLDKKITGATIRWVLLDGLGRTTSRSDVPADLVRDVVTGVIGAQRPESKAPIRGL